MRSVLKPEIGPRESGIVQSPRNLPGRRAPRFPSAQHRTALASQAISIPDSRFPAPHPLIALRTCASTAAIALMLTTRRTVAEGVSTWALCETPIRIGPRPTPSVMLRTRL